MYSEGSEYLPQNNDTALQYFKKASDLVRTMLQPHERLFLSELCDLPSYGLSDHSSNHLFMERKQKVVTPPKRKSGYSTHLPHLT